jgi:hypothetical protein
MAARGLLNTSASAEAGQSAAYDAALPIVQQDASTYASAQARQQEGDIASGLSSQNAYQSRIAAADMFGYDSAKIAQQISGTLAQYDKQGSIQASLDKQAQDNAITLEQMGITAQEANTINGILGDITVATLNNISNAINNSNISNKQDVIDIFTGFLGDTTLGAGAFKITVD